MWVPSSSPWAATHLPPTSTHPAHTLKVPFICNFLLVLFPGCSLVSFSKSVLEIFSFGQTLSSTNTQTFQLPNFIFKKGTHAIKIRSFSVVSFDYKSQKEKENVHEKVLEMVVTHLFWHLAWTLQKQSFLLAWLSFANIILKWRVLISKEYEQIFHFQKISNTCSNSEKLV